MAKNSVEVAALDGPAEGRCCATLSIVLYGLAQNRRHHAAGLAGSEACAPANALRSYQRGHNQRRGKRSQRVIERLGRFLDGKTFRTKISNNPASNGHSATVTLHGKRHFIHAWCRAGNKRHHGMQGSGARAFALQRREDITAESAAGMKYDLV